jgi:SAM-dependent methyltransferase
MIREWITLLHLARRRFKSDADYRRFQAYQGSLIVEYLVKRGIDLQGTRVLDLGCGNGGYSYALAKEGAQAISIDLRQLQYPLPSFVQADALYLPLESESFAFVFCASLIEHVPNPLQLLVEVRRILTPDGLVYLSFPPFYSPVGGHQFKPYHLLGEKLAIRLSGHDTRGFQTAFGNWGLYPLSVRHARQLITQAGLSINQESTRFMPFNTAKLPWVGEFLTWHVQFILGKRPKGNQG